MPEDQKEQTHFAAPPYCADPDCSYCRELREIAEFLQRINQLDDLQAKHKGQTNEQMTRKAAS
jgi:hypothetical protein